MTDNQSPRDDAESQSDVGGTDVERTTVSTTYKILGELSDQTATGILGRNTAASGTPIGVEGTVPNNPSGYGLSTPDDARIGGTIELNELAGSLTGGQTVTDIAGSGLSISDGSLVASGGSKWNDNDGDSLLEPNSGVTGIDLSATSGSKIVASSVDTAEEDFTVVTSSGDSNNNVVMGHADNTVGPYSEVDGSTIGGGGSDSGYHHSITRGFATISGGLNNTAGGTYATVGGGTSNNADGYGGTVGGGGDNTASGTWQPTVSGGRNNTASNEYATVGGGESNTASGKHATVPGGRNNEASGTNSVAAGRKANAAHDGAIVLGDSSSTAISSSGPDEVRSQMPIYAPSHNSTSARSQKTAIESVNSQAVLAGVRSLEVSTWEFTHTDDGRHLGPMAGAFHETFGLGDEETIASVDADGIALAAIQGIAQQLDDARQELATNEERIATLEAAAERKDDRIDELEADNDQLRERNDELESRLEAVEDHLNLDDERGQPTPADD
jgi:hypothetical protein